MYYLICEGLCNPHVAGVDMLVADAVGYRQIGRPITDDALIQAQRALHYTPHRSTEADHCTCWRCGHRRRFGKW